MARANHLRLGVVLAGLLAISACGTSTAQPPLEHLVEGGVFREGLVRIASEDPAKAQSVSERLVADQLYDGLTQWNSATRQADPAIAAKWQVSKDQKQWTFTLGDVKATNGEPVTATDVKRTLEHLARKGSLLAENLAPVVGFVDFTANAKAESLAGVTAVDDKTVRIDLSTPFSELPSLFSNPAFGIVHFSGNATFGTGPFVIAEKNADSWKLRKTTSTSAHLDEIDITFFPDASASYTSFKGNLLDWTPIAPEDAIGAGAAYGTTLYKPSLRTLSLSFNLANPKFADIRFREAIVRAVERGAVATKLDINASVLNGVVPEGVVGEQAGGCGTLCFHDRKKATALVKEVFPNGAPPIYIDVAKGSPFSDTATKQIVDDLSAIGVTANIRITNADQFGAVTVRPDRELFQTSWSAAYPTAGAFLDPLYRDLSPSNVSGLKNQDVGRHLDEAFATTSLEGRVNAYRDAEIAAMKQLPVLPIAEFPTDSVQSKRMRGISIVPMGTFDVANVWAAAPVS